jgi:hypothetical protein
MLRLWIRQHLDRIDHLDPRRTTMLNKYSANTPEMWGAAMLVPPVVHEAVSLREPADRIWLPEAQMSTHEPQLAPPVRKSCIGSCILQKKAYEALLNLELLSISLHTNTTPSH